MRGPTPEPSFPDTGFKIHVSTAHDRAREILTTVVPLLVAERVAFKVLVDEFVLDLSNSHMWARGASGNSSPSIPRMSVR
ncbi:hypothetical protein ACN28S_29135 [Cystobacter fuscus]